MSKQAVLRVLEKIKHFGIIVWRFNAVLGFVYRRRLETLNRFNSIRYSRGNIQSTTNNFKLIS